MSNGISNVAITGCVFNGHEDLKEIAKAVNKGFDILALLAKDINKNAVIALNSYPDLGSSN